MEYSTAFRRDAVNPKNSVQGVQYKIVRLMLVARPLLVGFLLLAFILIALLLTIFIMQQKQDNRQQAATTCAESGGVTRTLEGTYHFSWLHVAGGKIIDGQGCPVTLAGFNTAGLEFGDGWAGYSAARFQAFRQNFNMNIWRVSISPVWWNDNDYLPAVKMNYQDWIKQVISWMEENGNYVELDPTAYHTFPPASSGPYCAQDHNIPPCITSQNTPNNPPWTEQQKLLATQKFWQSIAPLYKDDPAILYDALNEPYAPGFANYHADLSQLVTTIQHTNPKAMIFVYGNGIASIVKGTVPDYPQQNLIYTFHPYPDPTNPWQGKLARIQSMIPWIQNHNHGVSIEEWGDSNLVNNVAYADSVLSIVKMYDAVTTYYQDHNALTAKLQLSPVGQVIKKEYASLPPVISLLTTPSPTPLSFASSSPTEAQRRHVPLSFGDLAEEGVSAALFLDNCGCSTLLGAMKNRTL